MFALDQIGPGERLRVVALGAHADDVEIGAAGTLLRLIAERDAEVTLAVFSGGGARGGEARASADALLADAAEAAVHVLDHHDGYFPMQAEEIKDWVRATLEPIRPHLVLTHRRDDAHQDHRVLAELAWQAFRGATIAAYEIPKWDGDLGRPNAYVTLSDDVLDRKLALLREHFRSQHGKGWYDDDTFRGLARIRGVEAGARWAEAFECAKLVW